ENSLAVTDDDVSLRMGSEQSGDVLERARQQFVVGAKPGMNVTASVRKSLVQAVRLSFVCFRQHGCEGAAMLFEDLARDVVTLRIGCDQLDSRELLRQQRPDGAFKHVAGI